MVGGAGGWGWRFVVVRIAEFGVAKVAGGREFGGLRRRYFSPTPHFPMVRGLQRPYLPKIDPSSPQNPQIAATRSGRIRKLAFFPQIASPRSASPPRIPRGLSSRYFSPTPHFSKVRGLQRPYLLKTSPSSSQNPKIEAPRSASVRLGFLVDSGDAISPQLPIFLWFADSRDLIC
ncbi:hypothetical protein J2Z37_004021 [Ammoniphilus resinae]|uniref:Uncharacterized protein n=1 Tax=Ammoniphilus resinae TaxID=861532 RepID=A0ABS4GUQ8_9BACL|nr:hypothetical protein [Ammoniphilus resinae]